MASAGHMLQQQSQNVATQLKRIVNNDLKEICRAYGKQVSGNKSELQKRCIDILDDIVARGDPGAFDDFKYRVNHRGQAPPQDDFASRSNGYDSSSGGYSYYPMAPGSRNPVSTQNRIPNAGKYFKPSPFYEIVDTVVPLQDLPDTLEMPQNRNTVRAQINLSAEQANRMASGDIRLLMYCGQSHGMGPYHPVDIAFPNQIEVKINDDDVKHNFKGLKNKPGSTKPADLTGKVRAKANYPNQVTVTYALTTKRYAFVVYLVRYISAATLTERIKTANVIPKDRVIQEMRKANADPDIEATSTRMSLKDPISTVRITLPVRSTVCTHTQCFDGAMFMQLVEQAPQWNCPVCTKTISFASLCVDKYFEDILNRTPNSIEKVDVEPDGEWRMIKEEDSEQQNGGGSKARAAYDDDFDDDLMEVPDPTNKPINGIKRESQPPSMLSPMMGQSFNTPPLSSREPSVAQSAASGNRSGSKRPAGAVIDLTLSDDEDEPPRPAKRQTTTQSNQGTSNSSSHSSHHHNQQPYTPLSLPDRNNYQPPPSFRQADTYRPARDNSDSYRPSSDSYRPDYNRSSDNYRPTSHAGPPPSPHNTAQYPAAATVNGGPLSNPASPAMQNASTAGYSSFAARQSGISWPVQQSRPPSQPSGMQQPFTHRPPPSPGGMPSPSMGSSNLRLPPMHIQPPPGHGAQGSGGFYGAGWRSDSGSGSYSNSPG